jgi:phospho-N-acetylmuramoyl-pentapeptide-transferase
MGGVLILLVVTATFLLLAKATPLSILAVGTMLGCGMLGFIDDWSKVSHERSLGLRPRAKLFWQGVISVAFGLLVVNWAHLETWVLIPLTNYRLELGKVATTVSVGGLQIVIPWLYLLLVYIMVTGMSNAVNLTDGLDGLAAGTVVIVTLAYAAIAFRQNALPTALLGASVAGACIGFLWYNSYPADIFMGDTGSLGLGAVIAALAVITKTELYLVIIGGIYVAETLSVILQVGSFKLTGKRVFKMAPLHHHFELIGWSEPKIITRFLILAVIFALFSLTTLKLR